MGFTLDKRDVVRSVVEVISVTQTCTQIYILAKTGWI